MRKVLLLSLVLLLVPISINTKNKISFNFKEKDKNYDIKKVKQMPNIEYKYIIYNNDRSELDVGTTYRIKPDITNINDILELCVGAGTGLRNCKYYDTENKIKSDWFETPLLANNTFVISFNKLTKPTGIVVQDIFDKSKFYKEYGVNFSSDEFYPLKNIKFINDDTIEITYVSNENSIESKIILLR